MLKLIKITARITHQKGKRRDDFLNYLTFHKFPKGPIKMLIKRIATAISF